MKTIQVTIEDFDEEVLKHDLLDPQDWLQQAVIGKIHNVKQRALKEAQQALFNDPEVTSIPASAEGCLQLYFSRPYYKNRAARDAEQQASLPVSRDNA